MRAEMEAQDTLAQVNEIAIKGDLVKASNDFDDTFQYSKFQTRTVHFRQVNGEEITTVEITVRTQVPR